jgi:hypothetical protein
MNSFLSGYEAFLGSPQVSECTKAAASFHPGMWAMIINRTGCFETSWSWGNSEWLRNREAVLYLDEVMEGIGIRIHKLGGLFREKSFIWKSPY